MRDEKQRIEDLINEAYNKLADMSKSLQDHELMASPARKLPDSILRRIFYHCLPTYRNPSMSSFEAPMLLTGVCSKWRSVALSYPYLWSKIYITFSYTPPHMREGVGFENIEKLMELRCAAVKTWLDRSGGCPLSISILHSGTSAWMPDNTYNTIEPEDLYLDCPTQNLLKIFTAQAHRWEDIELTTPSSVYLKLLGMIRNDSLVALKYVRLCLDMDSSDFFVDVSYLDWQPSALFLAKTPNLKVLALSKISLYQSEPSLWTENLAYLSCSLNIDNPMEAFTILSTCHNLIHCSFSISDREGDTFSLKSEEIAKLPRLRSISTGSLLQSRSVLATLLNHIDAPKLTQVKCLSPNHYFYSEKSLYIDTCDPFPWLGIFKTSNIQSVTLDPRVFSGISNELQDIFRALGSLNELVIAYDLEFSPVANSSCDRMNYPLPKYDYSVMFDLLTIDPERNPHKEIFLPNLEVFHASVNNKLTDETVYRCITSRMHPSAANGVRVLKEFRMMVVGEKFTQETLQCDIASYGEQVGVHTKIY